MGILNFLGHHNEKDIEHFNHLIQIAVADGVISDTEKSSLYRIGHKLGFSDQEIETFIESEKKSHFIPPYELSKRFERMYDVMKMIIIDGVIDDKEMELAEHLAERYHFKNEEIPALLELIIQGIKEGKDEEDLFEYYKKQRK